MIRKTILIATGASLFFLASCQQGNTPNIAGKWQAVIIESPTRDSMFQEQLKMEEKRIEGMTEKDVDSNAVKHFGTSDLNVIKKQLKEDLAKEPENYKKNKEESAKQLVLNLMQDGKAMMSGGGGQNDTSTWYFADNGKKLVLDPYEVKRESNPMQPDQVLIFDIVHAGSDSLRLRVHQPIGQDVFISLKSAKGEDKKTEEKK